MSTGKSKQEEKKQEEKEIDKPSLSRKYEKTTSERGGIISVDPVKLRQKGR